MTEQEIQNEINKRVKFKLDAFFTGIENRIKANKTSAFHLFMSGDYKNGQKAENFSEAWAHVKAAFLKEIEMPTSNDYMHHEAKDRARRAAIDSLFEQMEQDGRGLREWAQKRNVWLNRIEAAIDKAQDF